MSQNVFVQEIDFMLYVMQMWLEGVKIIKKFEGWNRCYKPHFVFPAYSQHFTNLTQVSQVRTAVCLSGYFIKQFFCPLMTWIIYSLEFWIEVPFLHNLVTLFYFFWNIFSGSSYYMKCLWNIFFWKCWGDRTLIWSALCSMYL